MPAPRGRKPSGPQRPASSRRAPVPRPRSDSETFEPGWPASDPVSRSFADHRPESTAGLRAEIADLRVEVRRLAAEIDKLWARERGRSVAGGAGRTPRSIAGKPVRTGTRASGARAARPRADGSAPASPGRARRPAAGTMGRSGPKRAGAARAGSGGAGKPAGTPGGVKRAGWAKAAPRSGKGSSPKRRGR